jgi:hypothetical protein
MSHPRLRAYAAIAAGVFVALLCLPSTSNAASGASGTAANPHLAQYHGLRAGQYHGDTAVLRGSSVLNRASGGTAIELEASIYRSVISPVLHFRSTIDRGGTRFSIDSSIGRPIATSIDRRNGDPRRMLQVGAVLGAIYIVFLAAWFWATRLRGRPPRRARA